MESIILSCGEFPDVPLIGSRGYFNYNLILSLKQLKYPMKGLLEDRLLEDLILHDMGVEHPPMLKRIRRSWGRINRKGKNELCKSNCMAKEPYYK